MILITKIELLSKYTNCYNEIIEIIDKSRLSQEKKKRVKDNIKKLLIIQSSIDTFDKQ